MNAQHSGREAEAAGRPAEPRSVPEPERTRTEPTAIWGLGVLFHVASRYPRRPDAVRVDRLAGILRNGLLARACCPDGSVCSDLRLTVNGTDVPYDSLVFLHRFGPQSWLYTLREPGRFTIFVDPQIPVLTPEAMGTNWVVLCQDEVYVRDRIAPEHVTGVAVHRADAASVMSELLADFRRLGIPLYDYEGHVLWQPDRFRRCV